MTKVGDACLNTISYEEGEGPEYCEGIITYHPVKGKDYLYCSYCNWTKENFTQVITISEQDIHDRLEQISLMLGDLNGPIECDFNDPDYDNVVAKRIRMRVELESEEAKLIEQLDGQSG